MKLSISNIAWRAENDLYMYSKLQELGFSGVEIAPTRIMPDSPYEHIDFFSDYASMLNNKYSLEISSVQSIWYGKTQKLFGSEQERVFLLDYTKKAIDLAHATGCHNIVFGCPKNRIIPPGECLEKIIPFFNTLGDYAYSREVALSIEAVPKIYDTNCINFTEDAISFVKQVNNPGFMVNLDIGTMVSNNESPAVFSGNEKYIKHVHVSEPYLELIKPRTLHTDIIKQLCSSAYDSYISIEMKLQETLAAVLDTAQYLRQAVAF